MQQYHQNKKRLVQNVFDQVYDRYDLMNDIMSFGIHRSWKKNLLNMINPYPNKNLIDVACGTGDIAKLFLNSLKKNFHITCVDPNKNMIKAGKRKIHEYKNLNWIVAPAEDLPVSNNTYDFYTISFGLRNTQNFDKTLKEAYRVLKPGGRFLCLEFSKINNDNLKFVYNNYSKLIPSIGKLVTGKREPYEYLTKSIQKFINQEELLDLLKKNNFHKCSYRNLSGGIVAIHSGWKI